MTTQQTERELFEESASDRYIRELEEKHGYDHPLAIAARLEQNISQYGGENCTTLFMYEAMGALRKGVKQVESLKTTIAQQGEALEASKLEAQAYKDGIARVENSVKRNKTKMWLIQCIKDSVRAALISQKVEG